MIGVWLFYAGCYVVGFWLFDAGRYFLISDWVILVNTWLIYGCVFAG